MNDRSRDDGMLTDLVEGMLVGTEWNDWLDSHPQEADEVLTARRVRALMGVLQASAATVPQDFEARLLARLQEDTSLLHLLDLGFSGLGSVLIDLLNILFDLLPQPQPLAA